MNIFVVAYKAHLVDIKYLTFLKKHLLSYWILVNNSKYFFYIRKKNF